MTEPRSIPMPFEGRAWLRPWAFTAAIGTLFLVILFVGYEIAERAWLRDRLSVNELFTMHIWRGILASVVLGTWTFYNVWRVRRRYDQAFIAAYERVEKTMNERTEALASAQAFTERLFDSLKDRVLVVNRDGTIVKANRVVLDDAGGLDPQGQSCAMFGDACAATRNCVAQISLRTARPFVGQRVHTDARTGRVFACDAYPVPHPGGGHELAIVVGRDITEAKQLEGKVREQEKLAALGVLAAGIAHDIANPLASISSELELLETEADPMRVKESVAVVRSHVARIDRTLREMTGFARRRGDEVQAVSARDAVDDAMRLVRHDPRARLVRFSTDVPGDLPQVRLVEDHLVMVLVNLLINALDAMPGGGNITIRAEAIEGYVRISVADTGVGMTEEVLRRATEPLFTTKGGARGTGLGLSISADVLRAASGSLDIDSAPGVGTTVHLSCPAVSHV